MLLERERESARRIRLNSSRTSLLPYQSDKFFQFARVHLLLTTNDGIERSSIFSVLVVVNRELASPLLHVHNRFLHDFSDILYLQFDFQ